MRTKKAVAKTKVSKETTLPPLNPIPKEFEVPIITELGTAGYKHSHGYIYDEYQKELLGEVGRRTYYEMMISDDTIGAAGSAIKKPILGTQWNVQPNKLDLEGNGAKFLEECIEDMEHPFRNVIDNALDMIYFGWSWCETVFKRRMGNNSRPEFNSKFDDGLIGIRKIAARSQVSLYRWELMVNGDVIGFHQWDQYQGLHNYIPATRSLHFKVCDAAGSPESISLFRNCYKNYFYKKTIEVIEGIGIERELAGLPVVTIPSKNIEAKDSVYSVAKQIARDLKFNEQGAVVFPSDPWTDENGSPTNMPMYDIKLINTGGARAIDTDKIVQRHNIGIMRSILAQFLMLGSTSSGSFALSKDHSDLFLLSIKYLIDIIEAQFNRVLIPRLWAINGFEKDTMPTIKAADVSQQDIAALAAYMRDMATAGFQFAGDEDTEIYVRQAAGLPANPENIANAQALAPSEMSLDVGNDKLDEFWRPNQNKDKETKKPETLTA